jgi:hypothetical protein
MLLYQSHGKWPKHDLRLAASLRRLFIKTHARAD